MTRTGALPWLAAVDLSCLVVCAVAAAVDVRTYRLPNRLTFGALGVGLLANGALGWVLGANAEGVVAGLLAAVAGALSLGLVFASLAALGLLGLGDVKLLAAVGAWVRWPLSLSVVVYVAVAGGVVGVVWAAWRGELGAVLANTRRLLGRVVGLRPAAGDSLETGAPGRVALHRVPYALAILAGTAYGLLSRYWPALRLG